MKDMRQIASAAFSLSRNGFKLDERNLLGNIVKENEPNDSFMLRTRIKDGKILDPLGRPYNLSLNNGVIVIWCVGANGVDDGGEGDDIKYSEQVADK